MSADNQLIDSALRRPCSSK